MNSIKIGILGGMGPRATVAFEERLLRRFEGSDQAVPEIICLNNGGIPDRTAFLQGKGSDPLPDLVCAATQLKRAGVSVVCLPCNTAHSPKILARLMAVMPLPIIDMPAAAMLESDRRGLGRVLVLGTQGTRDGRMFDARATNTVCVYPDQTEQAIIDRLIAGLKKGEVLPDAFRSVLQDMIRKSDCDAVILGCTELSLLPKEIFGDVTTIDTLDILADSCANITRTLYLHQELEREARYVTR